MSHEISKYELRIQIKKHEINYFLEKIEQYELISGKHKKVCETLSYTKHFLIFAYTGTGCISISAFSWYSQELRVLQQG